MFQPRQFSHFQENAGENTLCCNVKTTLATFYLSKCVLSILWSKELKFVQSTVAFLSGKSAFLSS